MKTLEEAIEHAEQVYKENQAVSLYARKRGENNYAEQCLKCAEEHKQLMEWLQELQERREIKDKYLTNKPEYEPVTAEDFARTMSETSTYSYMAWYSEALSLMKRTGFVICKKKI